LGFKTYEELLLFLIYVNDIAKNINAYISLFADDTTPYYSAKCPLHLHKVLSQDLSTLYNWSKVWNINFNPSETAIMTISNQSNIHPPLFFNNIHLSESDTHRHLGLIFHHSLSWHTHILHLHQKVMTKINRLRSFSNSLPRHFLVTIYKTNILYYRFLTMEALFMTTAPIATDICWIRPNSPPLKSY